MAKSSLRINDYNNNADEDADQDNNKRQSTDTIAPTSKLLKSDRVGTKAEI